MPADAPAPGRRSRPGAPHAVQDQGLWRRSTRPRPRAAVPAVPGDPRPAGGRTCPNACTGRPSPTMLTSMTQAVIRRATLEDAEALSGIGRETFVETFGHLYPPEELAHFLTM